MKISRSNGTLTLLPAKTLVGQALLFFLILLPVPPALFAQQFRLEQTEALITESWSSTPFRRVSYLNFRDSLNGLALIDSVMFSQTKDGGRTWKNRTTLAGQNRTCDIIALTNDTLFYISVNNRLVFSYDGGVTWVNHSTPHGLTGQPASMVFHSRTHGILATTSGELFRTTDGGFNWVVIPGVSAGGNTRLERYGNYTIGYKSATGFILSTDNGDSWQQVNFTGVIPGPNYMKIMGGKIYISTGSGWYYIANIDGTITYSENTGSSLQAKMFAFPNEHEVWAAQGTAGTVKVSAPGSGVWNETSFPCKESEFSGVFESFNGQILVAGYDVYNFFSLMMLKNPGSRFSVRTARLPGNYRISAVRIINPSLYLMGTLEGFIFRSTDYGKSWVNTTAGSISPAVNDIAFKDANLIFAGCTNGIILRSTNSGLSWSEIATNIPDNITGIEFKPTDSLFIITDNAGYVASTATLSNFVQLGRSFSNSGNLYKIRFQDRHSGYIGGQYRCSYTVDGGKTWIDYPGSYLTTVNTSRVQGAASYTLQTDGVVNMKFSDNSLDATPRFSTQFRLIDNDTQSGYMLDNYLGAISAIYPGSGRFEYFRAGGPRNLKAFDYHDPLNALAAGDNGEILFISQKVANDPPMICTNLIPSDTAIIHGREVFFEWKEPSIISPNLEYRIELAKGDTGSVLFSQQGLKKTECRFTGLEEENRYFWRVQARNEFGWGEFTPWTDFFLMRQVYTFTEHPLPGPATVNSVSEGSNGVVWAAGDGGFIAKSSTFGTSWEVVPVQFTDDFNHFFVNQFTNSLFLTTVSGELIYSSDGGNTWQKKAPVLPGAVVNSMIFSSPDEGYLCGSTGLFARSTDGGATWIPVPVPSGSVNLNAIITTEDGTILIAADDGIILRSTDHGGQFSISEIFSGDDYKALFSFAGKLFLLNQSGSARTSSDGGITWGVQPLNFRGNLVSIDSHGLRFRILSGNNALYSSTRRGDGLSQQFVPGNMQVRTLFLTTSGNLIMAGTGSSVVVGKDTSTIYNSIEESPVIESPGDFKLFQNYPNPFNGSTVINFTLPENSDCRFEVFSPIGSRVFESEIKGVKGTNSYNFDASSLNSGVYLYRLTAGGKALTGKMVLLK